MDLEGMRWEQAALEAKILEAIKEFERNTDLSVAGIYLTKTDYKGLIGNAIDSVRVEASI